MNGIIKALRRQLPWWALGTCFLTPFHLLASQAVHPLPEVGFASPTSGVAEEEGFVNLVVKLSASSGVPVVVEYTVSGGTASPQDYSLSGYSVRFEPGELEKEIRVRVTSDDGVEPAESILLSLTKATPARLKGRKDHRIIVCNRSYRQLQGAFYFRYASGERWEKFAKVGRFADVMVKLGPGDDRLVFWRGSSYLPFLDFGRGKSFAQVMVPQRGDGPALRFDQMCRHSHVRILEDSEARVRILWRYVPDLHHSDPEGWTEEYFTVYPDGACFRRIMEGSKSLQEYRDPEHQRLQPLLLTSEGICPMPRSWVKPVDIRVDPETLLNYSDLGYDPAQGHYALATMKSGLPGKIGFRLNSKTVNPALTVQEWGSAPAQTFVDGKPSHHFRTGYAPRMGNDDLIIWFEGVFPAGSEIVVEPKRPVAPVVRRPVSDPYLSQIPLLPEGSPDPGPFGAYYTTLRYWDEWDQPWRVGDYADVVVQFDQSSDRLVFWRGTTYVPHWVNEKNIWYNNEFCERRGKDSGLEGLCEPMQDHESRFSRVRIIHSSPARALVHWRYAPTTLDHSFFGVDKTGWGDWVDDYYYVYPDESCVRDTTLYTSMPNVFNEWHEAIPLINPGRIPEDILEPKTLAMASADGRSRIYDFSHGFPPDDQFEDGLNILLIRVKGLSKPFAIAESAGQWFDPISRPDETLYNHYDDWPAWPKKYRRRDWERNPNHGYREFWRFLPSHSSLMHLDWDNYESDLDGPVIFLRKILLNGMTHDDDVRRLVPLARFWENAPQVVVSGYGFSPAAYEKSQKAYILDRRINWVEELVNRDDDRMINKKADKVDLKVLASQDSPVLNPCFIIRNWPANTPARLTINGREVSSGSSFRQGIEKNWDRWESQSSLVVWVEYESEEPVTFTLEMDESIP